MKTTDLKQKKSNPLLKGCRNTKYSWLAAACTLGIMIIVYYCYDLIPFGDVTILRMDLYHQYGPLFAELYEKNGNVPFLMTFTNVTSGGSIDGTDVYMLGDVLNNIEGYNYITACYGLDAYAETPVIENILDSERVRTYFETEQRYKDAGYSFDASSEDYPCLVTSGMIMRNTPYYEDGYWYIPSGSLHWSETRPCGKMLGIAKNSTHQTEAAAFLELIAKDVQFRKSSFQIGSFFIRNIHSV